MTGGPFTDGWHETMTEQLGYVFCRPCDEYHRGEECWVDENGVSRLDLAWQEHQTDSVIMGE